MILDASLSPDARAIVEGLYAVRDAIAGHREALERIAAALETEREWFDHAPVNDAVDAVILAELSSVPQSVEYLSERIRINGTGNVFDGNIPTLQARLTVLAMMGKVTEHYGHMWSLVLTEAA